MLVNRPQPWSLTGPQLTPLATSCSTVVSTSSHIRYSSCAGALLPGCTATSPGGSLKISHPPPASTCGYSSTSRKNARSASASRLYTITWAPVITPSRYVAMSSPPGDGLHGYDPA